MAEDVRYYYAEIIYGLKSADGKIGYIGRTMRPTERLAQHKRAKTPLGEWVRTNGVAMVELEMCEFGKQPAGPRERYWIEHYREAGEDLFNIWPQGETLRKLDRALAHLEAERAQ